MHIFHPSTAFPITDWLDITMGDLNVQICPDNHRCENGSVCVEKSSKEGSYVCDCSEAMLDGATIFSGLYCQHEATVFCTLTGKVSTTSFCTNNGICRGNVDEKDEHLGCDCPKGYTGKHCQFVEGSEVTEEFGTAPTAMTSAKVDRGGDGTGLGTAGVVSIILVALFILGLALGFLYRRHAQHAATHVIDASKSSDGNIHDAEGSNMVVPTDTFESDSGGDESKIHAVDSGHLA